MFDRISDNMKKRMAYLEEIDRKDREDGTPRLQRLRQIPPETGKFLALIASNCPQGEFIEIGTSAGYSTLWISLACMERNIKIKTFEILSEKVKLAEETFKQAQVNEYIELTEGDALENLNSIENIAFGFLDAEKEVYEKCYDFVIPRLVKGGVLIADNAINHYEKLKPMIEKALNDERVDSLVVPIGKGELVCRKK
ncbi:MAG: class I SAM-dependent methyltransferase [Bacteroidetes bacterium]|jgi:predicted O-methyltransferase YrrM|nr:class I SAM-dependent methyltransferase [Bacteroidota bacterium]